MYTKYARKVIPIVAACITMTTLSGAAITSGSITITGSLPSGSFNFSGDGFAAAGTFSLGSWGPLSCNPCAPGSALSVTGLQSGNDFGSGSATIGGTLYNVNWGGLNAAGPSNFQLSGAPILLDQGPGTYTGAFDFVGELCGVSSSGIPQPCIASLPSLTGSGLVSINVIAIPDHGILQYTSATYLFSVPEPSTLALTFPAGLLLLYGARRARRRG